MTDQKETPEVEVEKKKIVISDKAMLKQTGIPEVVKKPVTEDEWKYAGKYLKAIIEKFKKVHGESVEESSPGTWVYVNGLQLKHKRYQEAMAARLSVGENQQACVPLTQQYILIEHSGEVADMDAPASALYPIVALANWKAAHQKPGMVQEDGSTQSEADEWLTSSDLTVCKGKHYNPSEPAVYNTGGVKYFNTYRAPYHVENSNVPTAYLDHMEFLIPSVAEREVFHDWLAYKLQNPGKRSYAIIMVADLKQGQTGYRYGTGRSTIGDIIASMFQTGVAKLDVEEITGTGGGQSSYNEWADGTQLCLCEETSDDVAKWGEKNASYEALKKIIDIRPIPDVRIKPKYGKIFTTTVYTNFLFFTNHSDALQLPADDRRFYVLDNNTGRRTQEAYAEIQKFLNSKEEIAGLYHWYMRRNVEAFDHVYPEMTVAKQRMIGETASTTDEHWDRIVDSLPACIVSKNVLLEVAKDLFEEELDIDDMRQLEKSIKARWRKLAEISAGFRLRREDKVKKYPALRIIKEVAAVQNMYMVKDMDSLRTLTVEGLGVFKKNWSKGMYEFIGNSEGQKTNVMPFAPSDSFL